MAISNQCVRMSVNIQEHPLGIVDKNCKFQEALSSVYILTKDLHLLAYKVQITQELKPHDHGPNSTTLADSISVVWSSSQTMDYIVRAYDIVFYERADPRVKDWPLMRSPWPLFSIITCYLVIIKIILPAYMKSRAPYELRTIIKWYNVVQIIANAVVTWGIMTSGWTTTYHFGCVLPDYSLNPEPLRMLRFLWWTIILKLLELFETVFFLMRKKERQASFLHVYHHCSTLTIIWVGVKYVGGGIASFSPMINNAVHVIMYGYYLLSAEGSPNVKATLIKYKKWLTIMQMIQFTFMLVYSAQVFLPSCPASMGIPLLFFPNVIFVYYMFYNFFKESYVKKGKAELNGNGVKKSE